MKKRFMFILLIFIMSIGFVSASENTTDIISNDVGEIDLNEAVDDEVIGDGKYSEIYVNKSHSEDGDGLSPETAYNTLNSQKYSNLNANGIVHLAEGKYDVPVKSINHTIVGCGDDTIISSFWSYANSYHNFNYCITFINVTFKVPSKNSMHYLNGDDTIGFNDTYVYYGISLDGKDFRFINCTFLNTSIVSGQNQFQNPNRDGQTDIFSSSFKNCKFLNYSYDPKVEEYDETSSTGTVYHYIKYQSHFLITSYAFTKYSFNDCIFENLTADAIIDSNGGQTDNYGRYDGAYIYNSIFKNCTINGIVKARLLSSCEIIDCKYDFDAYENIDLISPFYVNKTKKIELNKTKLTINTKDNNVIITLTDVTSDKPISGVEVGIFNNGKVFDYKDTDVNGQIILNDLVGTFNFEFSYPGDPYAYHPTSVNKTFTFKAKVNTVFTVKNINSVYNTAKKWTFTLKDINNNVLPNKKVTVKLDKNYEVITNSKGQAVLTLPTNLIPKTYTATITFAGDNNYNKVSTTAKVIVSKATPKLTTKKLTTKVKVKTKKVTATLKGVPKNTKVTLKIKGKTYKATTNKKGVATFKVTKLNKKGTFKGTVKFAGNKYFKAVSKTVKVVVKK